jgi:acetyl esterase/lipase
LFPAQLHDCRAAVRWLRTNAEKFKVNPQRVGGFGYSAGGHLVALMGALGDDELREEGVPDDAPSARLQVVLAGGAPCDFRPLPGDSERVAYWLGGTRAKKAAAYRDASPAYFVTPDDPPMFFFHGERDELVPIISPMAMVALLNARQAPAEFHVVPGAGHFQAITNGEALNKAIAFADKHLKSSRTPEGKITNTPAGPSIPSLNGTAVGGGPNHGK